MPGTQEIPRATWDDFFAAFSRDHETDLVGLDVLGGEIGAQVEGRTLLLAGISAAEAGDESLALMFDSVDGDHLTHIVQRPRHIWIQKRLDNTDESLAIESDDGTKTLLRFSAT